MVSSAYQLISRKGAKGSTVGIESGRMLYPKKHEKCGRASGVTWACQSQGADSMLTTPWAKTHALVNLQPDQHPPTEHPVPQSPSSFRRASCGGQHISHHIFLSKDLAAALENFKHGPINKSSYSLENLERLTKSS